MMACGTGKTFTALRIAEEIVQDGQRILFAAPTIALVSQARRDGAFAYELQLRHLRIGQRLAGDRAPGLEPLTPCRQRTDARFPSPSETMSAALKANSEGISAL